YVRVNTLRGDLPHFVADLEKAGIAYRVVEDVPACVEILAPAELKKQEKALQTRYYPQDLASQYACRALEARPGDRVADVCAAPGGKSLTVAQYMENTGAIFSGDLYPAKCDILTRRAADMGATVMQAVCRDASQPPPAEWVGTFDRVICDAPCSGLGVIRRKPEIRYKSLEELAALPPLQLTILEEAAKLVKPGGVLQYSTCTLNPAENGEVAQKFLAAHPEFSPRPLPGVPESVLSEPDWCRTLFPFAHKTDGFFIAGFQKNV
ncbi:MAG: 16S rRNA (cytosine(967)-C(5))-methyltransferase RsmB, partial [Clostridia bacterium]|nr:16S rRNA (cytosine(967)-C(5))-methyltransferase RsmB [Clostridia bacterium]